MNFLFLVIFLLVAVISTVFSLRLPTWNMPVLNPKVKYGGASVLAQTTYHRIFFATPGNGTYNMAPMISFFNGYFLATWKNAPQDEDEPGQRILSSISRDGINWGTPSILFPNISTAKSPVHLFAEPTLLIEGRVYVAASPTQFCLYPDQYANVLLLRGLAVDSSGAMKLSDVFWASPTAPSAYSDNTHVHGLKSLSNMDPTTQQDIKRLLLNQSYVPCDALGRQFQAGHTAKCEYCPAGCQDWSETKHLPIGNERTHYSLPTGGDVLLYRGTRDGTNKFFASVRDKVGGKWQGPAVTNISDDVANLNAGNLPDGRAFLVSNAMVTHIRDPLYFSLTDKSNYDFVSTHVVVSCEMDDFGQENSKSEFEELLELGKRNHHQKHHKKDKDGCKARYEGKSKKGGVQYPQTLAVNQGNFYVIFSLNKEDIWVSVTPMSVITGL